MNTFVASTLGLLTVAVVVLGIAVLSLMRQVGTVLSHVAPPRPGGLAGPAVGTELPSILEHDVSGAKGGVFVFLGTHCPACSRLEPVLPTIASHYPELSFVPIVIGPSEKQRQEHLRTLAIHGRSDCEDLVDIWNIPGTPFAVGVDASGRVATSGVVNALDQLEGLAEVLIGDFSVGATSSRTPTKEVAATV